MVLGLTVVAEDLETLFVRLELTGLIPGQRYDIFRRQDRFLGLDDTGARMYERELPDRRGLYSVVAHRMGWEAPATTARFRDFEAPLRPTRWFVCLSSAGGPHEWDFSDGKYPTSRGVLSSNVVHFSRDRHDASLGKDPDEGHVLIRSVHELAHYVEPCLVEVDGPTYTARGEEHAVLGSQYPVVISDTREARRGSITVMSRSLGDFLDIKRICYPASGRIRPVIFQSGGESTLLLDDLRAVILDVQVEQATGSDPGLRFITLDYVEIEPTKLIKRSGDSDDLIDEPQANFSVSDFSPKRGDWVTVADTSTGSGDDWDWSFGRHSTIKMGKAFGPGPYKVKWATRGTHHIKLRFGGSGAGYHTRTKTVQVH